jgi:predicted AlkP superfamily pyrophosphatase or phosphodiesterase
VTRVRHVVLVILDGLRPDAISPDRMPALTELAGRGWSTVARTVRPSVTVAALGSLATGVGPRTHGLDDARKLPSLPALRRLRPLPTELRRHRLRTAVCTAALPRTGELLARLLLGLAGVGHVSAGGETPGALGERARRQLQRLAPALGVVYVNDCDVAGHRHGWMSPPYLRAAALADDAVGALAPMAQAPGTLLLVTADHGGGGVQVDDHDAPHPLNDHIPLVAAGAMVHHASGHDGASLLDIPPTILDALDLPVPAPYEGRVLPLLAAPRAAAA